MQDQNIIGAENSHDLYLLQEQLGTGSTAVVYKALRLRNKEIVAIKQLKNQTQKAVKLITKEIKNMQSYQHQNILKYIANFKCRGQWYIVVEYCSKGTLQKYLTKVGKIPQSHCKFFSKCILKALKFLHQKRQIADKDLRLSNILINESNQLKIGKYGYFSQGNYNKQPIDRLTHLALEVLNGDPYTANCDVWSLGVAVFTMVFGRRPYEPTKLDRSGLTGMRSVLQRYRYKFPEDIEVSVLCRDFINLCLRKDHKSRPSSVDLMQHEWIQFSEMNMTNDNIREILSQQFKSQREIARSILEKTFAGVFYENFQLLVGLMQLGHQKIVKMRQILTSEQQQSIVSCFYAIVKSKLKTLSNQVLSFVIEDIGFKDYSYNIRFDQIDEFKSYIQSSLSMLEAQSLKNGIQKDTKHKFRRRVAEYVLDQVEHHIDNTEEADFYKLIPSFKSICNLLINQSAVSRVLLKWGGKHQLQPFLINELKDLKQNDISAIINRQVKQNSNLRENWLIDHQIQIKPAEDLESTNCQALLQVLEICSISNTQTKDLLPLQNPFLQSYMQLDTQ